MTSSSPSPAGWRRTARLPLTLTPSAVCARPDGSGVVVGYEAPDLAAPLARRRVSVLRVAADGRPTRILDTPGWAVAADLVGERLAMLMARPGPVFELWMSTPRRLRSGSR